MNRKHLSLSARITGTSALAMLLLAGTVNAATIYSAGVGQVGSGPVFDYNTGNAGATAAAYTVSRGDVKIYGEASASGNTIQNYIEVVHNPDAWFFGSYEIPEVTGRIIMEDVIFSSINGTDTGWINVSANFTRSSTLVTTLVNAKLGTPSTTPSYSIAIGGGMSLYQPTDVCSYNCRGGSYYFQQESYNSAPGGDNISVAPNLTTSNISVLLNTPYTFEFWYTTNQASADAAISASLSFNGFNLDPGYTSNVSAVPLPASLWLFASGLVGLVGIQKRRKNCATC